MQPAGYADWPAIGCLKKHEVTAEHLTNPTPLAAGQITKRPAGRTEQYRSQSYAQNRSHERKSKISTDHADLLAAFSFSTVAIIYVHFSLWRQFHAEQPARTPPKLYMCFWGSRRGQRASRRAGVCSSLEVGPLARPKPGQEQPFAAPSLHLRGLAGHGPPDEVMVFEAAELVRCR